MMRILVAQMTRMGDVLQTSPLIRALKQRHADARVTLMVRRMGRAIVERNPDVDDCIIYEEDDMFLDLRARDSDRLLRAYRRAESYIDMLKRGRFDICYNCTNTVASAMLLKSAGIPEVVGVHVTDDWQFVQRGRWTKYFFTGILHRKYNAINLCDVFRNFLSDAAPVQRPVFDVHDDDRRAAAALLQRHGIGSDAFLACFQLGASEETKRWSEVHFASLGRMLAERLDARIVLVGVQEEAPLGAAFAQHAPGVAAQLYGQTTVPVLAALLERANVLVTNDTGTMHIAAAVGCPTVLVSVGHVHFRETGPYGAGHCAVERQRESLGDSSYVPGGLEERSKLLPKHVARGVETVLGIGNAEKTRAWQPGPASDDVDLYVSRFAPDGCLDWYPVLRRPLSETDFLRIAYRAMWIQHLSPKEVVDEERQSLTAMLRCYAGPDLEIVNAWRNSLCAVFHELAELAKDGIADTDRLLESLVAGNIRAAQARVAALTRRDERIRLFGELNESTKPLVRISRYERDSLEGVDPVALAETTRAIYADLEARARLTAAKIERAAACCRA